MNSTIKTFQNFIPVIGLYARRNISLLASTMSNKVNNELNSNQKPYVPITKHTYINNKLNVSNKPIIKPIKFPITKNSIINIPVTP
jgi:hypothetical protein